MMEFNASVDLEYGDFLNWSRIHSKTSAKTVNVITKVFMIVALVMVAASLVILAYFDEIGTDMVICYIIFALAYTYLLFRKRITAKISQKMYLKNTGTQYVTINDEGIFSVNKKTEEKYFFSGICAIYHGGDTYFLLIDKNHAIVLPERSFTWGDPDDLAAFITEKTGLEIKEIAV